MGKDIVPFPHSTVLCPSPRRVTIVASSERILCWQSTVDEWGTVVCSGVLCVRYCRHAVTSGSPVLFGRKSVDQQGERHSVSSLISLSLFSFPTLMIAGMTEKDRSVCTLLIPPAISHCLTSLCSLDSPLSLADLSGLS